MPATMKLKLASVDTGLFVEAQYNPKEVQIVQPINWHEHAPVSGTPDPWDLEFGGVNPQTMQLELLFDGAECGGEGVTSRIQSLLALAQATYLNPETDKERPHYCVLVWGDEEQSKRMPRFTGIIESVTTKYTMWSSDGTVLRATCTVAMKECNPVVIAKKQAARNRVRRSA